MIKSFPIGNNESSKAGGWFVLTAHFKALNSTPMKNCLEKCDEKSVLLLITMGRYHATPHPLVKIKIGKENAKEI